MNRILISIALICLVGVSPVKAGNDTGMRLVNAARMQIGKTVRYDPRYQSIQYPNGDLPVDRGVCTDVVVRAFRAGLGLDLQMLIHEDMKRDFKKYPRNSGSGSPDKNIDHRRVINLRTYFDRRGWSIAVTNKEDDYKPGDLVTCTVPRDLPHIMIVSDKKTISGRPLIIHNIGVGAKEEDRLFEFKLTAHYRIKSGEQVSSPDSVGRADELHRTSGMMLPPEGKTATSACGMVLDI